MNSLEKILADGFQRIDNIVAAACDELDNIKCYEEQMNSTMKLFKKSFEDRAAKKLEKSSLYNYQRGMQNAGMSSSLGLGAYYRNNSYGAPAGYMTNLMRDY